MNRIFFLLIVVLSLTCATNIHAQKSQFQTKWQTLQYNKPEEVSNLDFLYDNKAQLLYLFTNDKENLYVHVRVINQMTQKKIIDHGFSVEIKIKGDKQKRTIEFPLDKTERMAPIILMPNNSEKRRKDFRLVKKQVVEQLYVMKVTGFKGKEIITVKCDTNDFNIHGKLSVNNNDNLQYFLTIPLKSLDLNLLVENSISISLASGKMAENSTNGPAQGQNSAGGDRRNTGGIGGGTNGGGMGDFGGMGSAGGVGNSGDRSQGQYQRQGPPPGFGEQNSAERQAMSTSIKVKVKNVMLLKEQE